MKIVASNKRHKFGALGLIFFISKNLPFFIFFVNYAPDVFYFLDANLEVKVPTSAHSANVHISLTSSRPVRIPDSLSIVMLNKISSRANESSHVIVYKHNFEVFPHKSNDRQLADQWTLAAILQGQECTILPHSYRSIILFLLSVVF